MTSPFSRKFTYPYAEPIEISENLRCVVANNPGPFTFTGTNTFIIGRGEVAILDPGPDDPQHLDALLKTTTGETVSHILISHTHKDHVGLASKLQSATGADTYAYSSHILKAEEAYTKEERMDDSSDRTFTPNHILSPNQLLDIGGASIEVLHTPGHTDDHLCFSLTEENTLLSGDHVMGWSTSVIAPPDGHMGDYLSSLENLLERPEKIYHSSHGAEIKNTLQLVEHLLSHRLAREEAIVSILTKGANTIEDIVAEIYRGLDKSLLGAAMLTVLAHLEWLEQKGQIKKNGPDNTPLSQELYVIT